ncbi:homocysteine S-methyltransferase family protein [Mediterraneibacter glycyrrhizinilyticus]|uniref:homocysteine S-methyltransferase family protein n=1 Tax=Mediterraneibacter glycyrrhizinilyticus TaxID=342942 RepID=UPI0019604201|nr:homocysteine S-methyltransferase family protein [Mediterraneibacter glycyrrhizinilyticus]MBM6802338.1 homocysteine S-methyltransferase family protein [Mediterraneibacter glycyrrhizinilyticus]MDM8125316.1 homocysteine S-methyltransferase family protein [Mediterraneibacter glycyrrhizinilyticus]MDM8211592.1 homocysteine S-methyltransferase family protein [Mediterraneibacter glycyrrhizinilyticus]
MITDRLGKELLFFDGGMGTLLQEKGLAPGELPETWNISRPEVIKEIHKRYIEAGSDIVLTNTFGANALKFHAEGCSLEEIVKTAVDLAKKAAAEADTVSSDRSGTAGRKRTVYTALDIGPTGKLLKPMGDLDFETAYEAFREVMVWGEEAGADLIHIETMSDTYELKAAVLAAKENTSLPVFATAIFDERRKLLTGADVPSVIALLEGLRVDALGINCGMGPEQMLPVVEEYIKYSSLPVIVKPNAGLPKQRDGHTYYDVSPEEFAGYMGKIVSMGACVIGGCCGTTPDHIQAMTNFCRRLDIIPPSEKNDTIVSSYGQSVFLGKGSKIIGERINPTGKKKFKQALKDHDLEYILREGIAQQDNGAHILDVNVGLPDIDEISMMKETVQALQSVVNLPLQIDTVDAAAMEAALRIYNGKAMVNSVSGKQESMDKVFPLIRKYGGVVIGLTLDEAGIPGDAEGRVRIAERIISEAAKYGIKKKDIVIDALAMTISSEPDGAKVTLETLRRLRDDLNVNTVLGVSNISFGLPARPVVNAAFYTMAMMNGLSAGIINPSSEDMMKAWYAYHALMGLDANCESYIDHYSNVQTANVAPSENGRKTAVSLRESIEKGLKEDAALITAELSETQEPLGIINTELIPALNHVGDGFEAGTIFLPQLLMSAEAAKSAFAILKDKMDKSGEVQEKIGTIILATVKGDIHDIGKNIVKVLLENYSFDVIDLGKDVAPEQIVDMVLDKNVKLVGLSALMTTTVVSMEETIHMLREQAPQCKVMVGGAVLNQEYADMIGADFYGKDAMQSVRYAQELFAG